MKRSWRPWIIRISIPVIYALLMRFLFGIDRSRDLMVVMSWSFLVAVPFAVGYLTVALSPIERVRKLSYRILAPWVPIFAFLAVTLVLSIEGWACWLMILPVFLVLATIGGLLAGRRRIRRADKPNRLQISLVVLLPLFLSPMERLLPLLLRKAC